MGFQINPDPGDRGEPDVKVGRVDGAEAAAERRLYRDGAQVLARGALVCPGCGLPTSLAGRVPAGRELRCGFCDHTAPARLFIREGAFDTAANDVLLVARV